jgi:short-subunit dehydrogenase
MQGKTVIITGASSGIGEACAYAFANEGAKLVLAARNYEWLKQIEQKLISQGIDVLVVPCDVKNEAACKHLIESSIAYFGKIDVLVNNAGISMRALFKDVEIGVMEELMQTNFWGAVYCTKYALPYLLESKGSVIGVNSWAGFTGLPARTGYTASKFALLGFLEALRVENLKTGLHVGSIFPGYTTSNIRNTALNARGEAQLESPLEEKKLMPAGEVAAEVVNMVKQRRKYHILTFTGKLMYWVNKLFPSYVDKKVYEVVSREKNSPFY